MFPALAPHTYFTSLDSKIAKLSIKGNWAYIVNIHFPSLISIIRKEFITYFSLQFIQKGRGERQSWHFFVTFNMPEPLIIIW